MNNYNRPLSAPRKDIIWFENYYLTLVRDTFIIIIYHYICTRVIDTRVIEYKED